MIRNNRAILAGMLAVVSLTMGGCSGGQYDGLARDGSGVSRSGGDAGGAGAGGNDEVSAYFASNVQPHLNFCRTCHVPDGVADTDDGRGFQLSRNSGDDYLNTHAAWEALGGGVDASALLIEPSAPAEPHSGGKPWPVGAAAYVAMRSVLSCWDSPSDCSLGAVAGPTEELPLIASKRATHLWQDYCDGRPDAARLPPDPRSQIVPGANRGRAVFFNAFFEDCHTALPEEERPAMTCGEYRARRDRGLDFLLNELPVGSMSAEDFNNTWQKWGFDERPDNFDELYTLRYGLNFAPFDNPYPLPGEDPNAAEGGSGQLPLGLRQLRDEQGRWTGQIGSAACFLCHGGQIGEPREGEPVAVGLGNLGLGNNNYDVIMAARDGAPWAQEERLADNLPAMDGNTLFNIGIKQRGQNNAVGAFEFLNTLLDLDSLGFNPNPSKTILPGGVQGVQDTSHPLAHTQDTPPWWNMGMRPRKFFDAGVSNDSTRIIMAAGPGELNELFSADGAYYRNRIEEYDQDLEAFFLSLNSPEYPAAIDMALAAQGAILFHTKDLWNEPGNASAPRPPGGNGSCASCHGVYSPRYAHNPDFLANPQWEGIAAHISPLDVIGTDPARSDMLTPTLRDGWDTTFWGYPEGADGYVPPGAKDPITEAIDDTYPNGIDTFGFGRPIGDCGWQKAVIGYQAPPLYGVWATAPYFHNGSVPTVEQVLDSSRRASIWQRQIAEDGPVKGFDQSLSAYDFSALGWKSQAVSCEEMPGGAEFNCNPVDDQGPSTQQLFQNWLSGQVAWAGAAPANDPYAQERRLYFDTRILGNGNGGHTFTDVLTERERTAIIEYLKTL